jgi:hypothetical protein
MQHEVAYAISCRKDAKEVVEANYYDVLSDPLAFFVYLRDIGFPVDPERAASIVKPEYCHFRSE